MAVGYEPFDGAHLESIVRLCAAEGWPSFPDDPARAARALLAPGVTTVVARDGGQVVGFATMLSDGEIQAYLSLLVVAAPRRGEGIGHALVEETFRRAGGVRVDLLAEDGAVGFYAALPHRRRPGSVSTPPASETAAARVQPVLIVVGGLPGTGKSTLADGLAERLAIPVFNKDRIEASLRRDGDTADRDSWRVAENLLTTLAGEQLRRRQSAILDTVARTPESRATWRALAATAGERFRLIECVCSDRPLHQARLEGRVRGIPGWNELSWSDVEQVRARSAPWPDEHLVVDAVRPVAANLEVAMAYVTADPPVRTR